MCSTWEVVIQHFIKLGEKAGLEVDEIDTMIVGLFNPAGLEEAMNAVGEDFTNRVLGLKAFWSFEFESILYFFDS